MDTTHEPISPLEVTPEVISPASVFPPQTLAIASLVFAAVLVAFFTLARRRSSTKGSSVLLVGPSDSGKTAILSTLVYGTTLQSHASTQANVSQFTLSDGKSQRVVDVPGHPRIRDQFSGHLPDAKALVFVVDASTISRTGPAVAEHLHHVLHALTSLPPSQTIPSLLISAHKADLIKTTPGGGQTNIQLAQVRVRNVLERELERRRIAQAGGVGVEGTDAEETLGGLEGAKPGQPFRFADWEGGEVAFVGSFVSPGKKAAVPDEKTVDGLSELRGWIEEL